MKNHQIAELLNPDFPERFPLASCMVSAPLENASDPAHLILCIRVKDPVVNSNLNILSFFVIPVSNIRVS